MAFPVADHERAEGVVVFVAVRERRARIEDVTHRIAERVLAVHLVEIGLDVLHGGEQSAGGERDHGVELRRVREAVRRHHVAFRAAFDHRLERAVVGPREAERLEDPRLERRVVGVAGHRLDDEAEQEGA